MNYPIVYQADYVEKHSRLTTFFRWFLAIPQFFWFLIWSIGAFFVVLIAWFALLFTGRYPESMFSFISKYVRYSARLNGYLSFIADPYPAFGGEPDPEYPVRVHFSGPLSKYNRWKTFFRFILAFPLYVFIRYVISPLVFLGAFAAWIVILITGKMPRGLQDLLVLGSSYDTRAMGYFFYLTETYPPFTQDMVAGVTGDSASKLNNRDQGSSASPDVSPS